jgi:hypothetical protein
MSGSVPRTMLKENLHGKGCGQRHEYGHGLKDGQVTDRDWTRTRHGRRNGDYVFCLHQDTFSKIRVSETVKRFNPISDIIDIRLSAQII